MVHTNHLWSDVSEKVNSYAMYDRNDKSDRILCKFCKFDSEVFLWKINQISCKNIVWWKLSIFKNQWENIPVSNTALRTAVRKRHFDATIVNNKHIFYKWIPHCTEWLGYRFSSFFAQIRCVNLLHVSFCEVLSSFYYDTKRNYSVWSPSPPGDFCFPCYCYLISCWVSSRLTFLA